MKALLEVSFASCNFSLAPQLLACFLEYGKALALSIFQSQCAFLEKHGINVWDVDKQMVPRSLGSHDLVGSWRSMSSKPGLISIELKVGGAAGWENKLAKWKRESLARFRQLAGKQRKSFSQCLLLACKVDQGQPRLYAEIWQGAAWRYLRADTTKLAQPAQPVQKVSRPKPPLNQILASLRWYKGKGRAQVGLVNHFLKALRLPTHNIATRAKVWNKMLKDDRRKSKFVKQQLRFNPGSPAWVGNKLAFKQVYPYL